MDRIRRRNISIHIYIYIYICVNIKVHRQYIYIIYRGIPIYFSYARADARFHVRGRAYTRGSDDVAPRYT